MTGLARRSFKWLMMYKPLLLAALLGAFALPAIADRLPGARSLSDTAWGYGIVTDPVRAGVEAQRFEVRAGDCAANSGWNDCERDRERSEFRPDLEWFPGDQMWIGFSIFLPDDFPVSEQVKTTIAQIHQRGGPIRVVGVQRSRPPVMALELIGDALRLVVHVPGAPNIHQTLSDVDDLRGRWVDVLLHHSSGEEPIVEVWLDDQPGVQVRGWDMPPPDFFYFKYGVYRSFVSRHGAPMPTQIAYFDEVRMSSSLGDVRPGLEVPVD